MKWWLIVDICTRQGYCTSCICVSNTSVQGRFDYSTFLHSICCCNSTINGEFSQLKLNTILPGVTYMEILYVWFLSRHPQLGVCTIYYILWPRKYFSPKITIQLHVYYTFRFLFYPYIKDYICIHFMLALALVLNYL